MYINEEHKYKVENRGDNYQYIGSYKKGEVTIDGKNKSKKTSYIRVKCPHCGSEYDIVLYSFITHKSKCKFCCNEYEKSFAYHIQVELQEPLNKYWDWEKNTQNPYLIAKNQHRNNKNGENLKVWIKCTEKDYHGSYETSCYSFVKGARCPYCSSRKTHPKDSFAQWGIDKFGNDFLEKYWSDKNTLNPWKVSQQCNKKAWFKCNKIHYHDDYYTLISDFYNGKRCGYCGKSNFKVHINDSFGTLYPEIAKQWDYEKNNKSPYEVNPHSNYKYWFICESCNESYLTSLASITKRIEPTKCTNCSNLSLGEKYIIEYLNDKSIEFYYDEVYFKDLVGCGGGKMRPDFILPSYKVWIEFDGAFHYRDFYHDGSFETQQENDKIKDEYAKEHGYKMIRIPYWKINKISNILDKELIS